MIQHKKYDNETTDDMIKNENKNYKRDQGKDVSRSNEPVKEII